MTDALHILLGAALVLVGVLSGALADRIRGVRLARVPLQREASDARPRRQTEGAAARASKPAEPAVSPEEAMGREVTAALVKMGYSKEEAQEAVRGTPATDRHSLENWLRCALRRTLAKRTA